MADINEDRIVRTWPLFVLPGDKELPEFAELDDIVDAIEQVACIIDSGMRYASRNTAFRDIFVLADVWT